MIRLELQEGLPRSADALYAYPPDATQRKVYIGYDVVIQKRGLQKTLGQV